ncbi:hypothetical protein [Egbenema bharatensis]|uniref:hypothetical protein n=1 Tax=Egbenema bharatensis TaxID=3463334 RepID=UPI003A88803D
MIPANLSPSTFDSTAQSAVRPPDSTPINDPATLTYHNRLHPWCIIRLLPKMQRVVVVRFRRRNSAEEHLRVLKRLNPDATYEIVFDLPEY